MWKKDPEPETRSQTVTADSPAPLPRPAPHPSGEAARVGASLSFKGELVGKEDLLIDGEVSGTIELGSAQLTIGPEGRVEADINAREVVIEGTARGKIHASERLRISRSGNVVGELVAGRIVIEDGAYFKGSIDIQKPGEGARPSKGGSEPFRISAAPVATSKDKLQ